MARFVVSSAVRKFAMERASHRFKKFTRYAKDDWAVYLDDIVLRAIVSAVDSAPTLGKTLYPPTRQEKPSVESPKA